VEIRAGASFGESHFAVGMILWVVFKNSLGRDRFKSIIVTTFTLKQLSLPSSRAQVTWGGAEKEAKAQGFIFFLATLGDQPSDWPPPYLPPTYLPP
jgi:hypothetical protein